MLGVMEAICKQAMADGFKSSVARHWMGLNSRLRHLAPKVAGKPPLPRRLLRC